MTDQDLTGRHALVCGASSGIGRAAAVALAEQGATVTALARRAEALEGLVGELFERGLQARALVADLEDHDGLRAAVRGLVAEHGAVHVLLNNTGTAQTGNGRLTLGASHANLFDKDHQATFTYTTSPTEPGRVHQWGGYYRAPLYDHGAMVSGYYTTSSVSSGVVANTINVTGRGDFAGIAVSYYLAPKGDYRSYLTLGLDDKHFRNDKITTLGGAALFPNYRTRPLTLSYTGRFQKQWGQWGYNLEYAHNLSSGGGNDDAAYGANRAGASTSWNALRYGFDVAFPLPAQWLFMARLRGQDSGDALVPGEQFGIGGALSLRGLPERVLSGDSGHWGNLEFWTPALAENLRMLVFYDFGRIRRHNDATLPSASVSETLPRART